MKFLTIIVNRYLEIDLQITLPSNVTFLKLLPPLAQQDYGMENTTPIGCT